MRLKFNLTFNYIWQPIFFLAVFFAFNSCKKESISVTTNNKLKPPANGIYHSVYPDFGDNEDSVNIDSILNFELLAQKEIVWVYFSNNWWNGISFPESEVELIKSVGKIPHIRLMPRSTAEWYLQEQNFTLQNIIDGIFDSDLLQWATDAKNCGTNLNVEFGVEPNGDWFPWSGSMNGGSDFTGYGSPLLADGPERYRDAYRHIIRLFRLAGAENVTWFFHINYDSSPVSSWNNISDYYPGDEYIDWLGVSVYGPLVPGGGGDEWRSFEEILDECYQDVISISPDKPVCISECGIVDDPGLGDKSEWIENMLMVLSSGKFDKVKAFCYWNESWINDDGTMSNLKINSSTDCLAKYRLGVSSPLFVTEPEY